MPNYLLDDFPCTVWPDRVVPRDGLPSRSVLAWTWDSDLHVLGLAALWFLARSGRSEAELQPVFAPIAEVP